MSLQRWMDRVEQPSGFRPRLRWGMLLLGGMLAIPGVLYADDWLQNDTADARYFEALRTRGLFSVAENVLFRRLNGRNTDQRTQTVMELAATLTQHAGHVPAAERDELLERSRRLLDEEARRPEAASWAGILQAQQAMVVTTRAELDCWDAWSRPHDEASRQVAQRSLAAAAGQLREADAALARSINENRKPQTDSPTLIQRRNVWAGIVLAAAMVARDRAELAAPNSAEQVDHLLNSEELARRVLKQISSPYVNWRAQWIMSEGMRLRGNAERTQAMIRSLESSRPEDHPELAADLTATTVRNALDSGHPDQAMEQLIVARQKTGRLTGELWFLQARTLLRMREVASGKHDPALIKDIDQQLATTVQRCTEQAGGLWTQRLQHYIDQQKLAEEFGPELAAAAEEARAEYLAKRLEPAARLYATAARRAFREMRAVPAADLAYMAGSILLQLNKPDEAVDLFRLGAEAAPQTQRGSESELMAAYCLLRRAEATSQPADQSAAREFIEQIRSRRANEPAFHEATLLLARLDELMGLDREAIAAYGALPATHTRFIEACLGQARCVTRAISAQPPTMTSEELTSFIRTWLKAIPRNPADWTLSHAELASRAARLLLQTSPPQYALADQWLERVSGTVASHPEAPDWQQLGRGILPVRVLSLAGQQRVSDAEELLNKSSPEDIETAQALLQGLLYFSQSATADEHRVLASLIRTSLGFLERTKSRGTPEQQAAVLPLLAQAYIASGSPVRATEVLGDALKMTARKSPRRAELAAQLAALKLPGASKLALPVWHEQEADFRKGTQDWLWARSRTIEDTFRSGDPTTAGKMLKATHLLYRDLPTDALKERYQNLDTLLESPPSKQ